MHELSITQNVVAIVSEAAQGRRVRRVTLAVGTLSGVMHEAIAFCFPLVAEGTVVEGAVLDVVLLEGRARCNACATEFGADTLFAACPCGSRDVLRLQGEELLVKAMELEEVA